MKHLLCLVAVPDDDKVGLSDVRRAIRMIVAGTNMEAGRTLPPLEMTVPPTIIRGRDVWKVTAIVSEIDGPPPAA